MIPRFFDILLGFQSQHQLDSYLHFLCHILLPFLSQLLLDSLRTGRSFAKYPSEVSARMPR